MPALVSPRERPHVQSVVLQVTVVDTSLETHCRQCSLPIHSRFNVVAVVSYFLVCRLDFLITAKPEGRDIQKCRIPDSQAATPLSATLQFIHRIQKIHWADD